MESNLGNRLFISGNQKPLNRSQSRFLKKFESEVCFRKKENVLKLIEQKNMQSIFVSSHLTDVTQKI